MDLKGQTLLVTGGTGSFGTAFIRTVLERYDVHSIRVFSRDELKQSELRQKLEDRRVRFLLGDVRDLERLRVATRGCDLIVHAAALKQVPACEYNPLETALTNITGTANIITAALENSVPLTVGLSSDKSVNPVNLYGATKLVGERLLAQAGVYVDPKICKFASVRYGNVMGSRGSVVQVFREQAATGVVTITDDRMTRYWISLDQAVEFVLSSLPLVEDGETFVPKIPSCSVLTLADVLAPGCERMKVGLRPGEKLHEVLVSEGEANNTYDLGDRYVIAPYRIEPALPRGKSVPDGFRYSSDTNEDWLDVDRLSELLDLGKTQLSLTEN